MLLSESGSMVLADPAIRALHRRSDCAPLCVTFERNAPSLEITGRIEPEHVFAIRTDRLWHLPWEALRFARWAKRWRIGTVVDLELFSHISSLLGVLSGAGERVGFYAEGVAHGNLYTRRVAYNPHQHMARNYLMLAEAVLADNYTPPAPRLALSKADLLLTRRHIPLEETRQVHRALEARLPVSSLAGQRLVLVNANGSQLLPQRRWPEESYVALIQALLARHSGIMVVLIGARDDGDTTAVITRQVRDKRCVDGAGLVSMPLLPALFSQAELLISNDSGPAHFAAVTELPVIVLFGPETPRLYRPLGNARVITAGLACSPCVSATNQRRTGCTDNQCMQRISVAEVLPAANDILALAATTRSASAGPQRLIAASSDN
jgi:ADP-heptose:LPS heptosyltransferase